MKSGAAWLACAEPEEVDEFLGGLSDNALAGLPWLFELWALPPAAFGTFVAAIPAPLGVGKVTLDDGRQVTGFLCEAHALAGAEEITGFGGWRAYCAAKAG